MKRHIFIIISILSFSIFSGLIFLSSPYRQLRPYNLFGKKLPERTGHETVYRNETKTVLIDGEGILEPFYIDQIPVTISAYKECVRYGKCLSEHYRYYYTQFWESDKYNSFPVTFVNWFDARNYCNVSGGDLPTAQQWEIAAGYSFQFDYPWGNSLPGLSRANLDGYYQWLTPAGWLPEGASPFGVLDMAGNVREWVLDEIYSDNDNKLLKGGGDSDPFSAGMIESFYDHGPTSSGFNRGFRCVYPVE